jgi:hypothetical protein
MATVIDPKTADLRNQKPSNPSGRVDAGATPKTAQDGLPGATASTGEDEATPDSPIAEGQTTKM